MRREEGTSTERIHDLLRGGRDGRVHVGMREEEGAGAGPMDDHGEKGFAAPYTGFPGGEARFATPSKGIKGPRVLREMGVAGNEGGRDGGVQ